MSYYTPPTGPPPGAQAATYPGHPQHVPGAPPPQGGYQSPPPHGGILPAGSPPGAQQHTPQLGFSAPGGPPAPGGFGSPSGPPPGAPPPGAYGSPPPAQQHQHHQQHQQHQQPAHAQMSGPTIQDTLGSYEGVHFRIDHRDSNSLLGLTLQPGYEVKGKPGAMVAMSASVQIKGKIKMSFKKMITGGQMTESTFTGPGEVLLAPDVWGDVVPIRLDGQTSWSLSKDAFLACTAGVTRSTKTQGLGKAMFSGEGLFVAKALGVGILWIQSLGAIVQKQLGQGEQWIVDNGHLVAWTASYAVERIGGGGFISNAATAEGLVCRFTGPGIVYIQTRNPEALGAWIAAQVPTQGGGGGGGGLVGAMLS